MASPLEKTLLHIVDQSIYQSERFRNWLAPNDPFRHLDFYQDRQTEDVTVPELANESPASDEPGDGKPQGAGEADAKGPVDGEAAKSAEGDVEDVGDGVNPENMTATGDGDTATDDSNISTDEKLLSKDLPIWVLCILLPLTVWIQTLHLLRSKLVAGRKASRFTAHEKLSSGHRRRKITPQRRTPQNSVQRLRQKLKSYLLNLVNYKNITTRKRKMSELMETDNDEEECSITDVLNESLPDHNSDDDPDYIPEDQGSEEDSLEYSSDDAVDENCELAETEVEQVQVILKECEVDHPDKLSEKNGDQEGWKMEEAERKVADDTGEQEKVADE